MKPFLAHLRDEQQQRKAKTREQAIAASSENDPRADVNVPYESPRDIAKLMGDFSGDPEPISGERDYGQKAKPQVTQAAAGTGEKKLRGSRAEGMSVQQLATHFDVSQPTVSIQLKSAFDKFRQDPELSKWAESRKPRKNASFDMPSIDATTSWSDVKDYSYMQHYKSHIQDHARPHTGQTSPGRRKALPSKPAAEETTRVLKQQNGEWTEMGESTKTFRDIMVLLTEKMRRDPKQEKARLTARLKNIESETPKMSREEEKLAISTSPEVKKSKAGRIASGKLFKRGMKQAQAGDVDAALQGVEDVISGARGKKASVLEREFGSKSNVRAYRTARSRYNKK